ncbi:Na(+)/H(+) exchanger protein 2-like isoform X2 [Argiope bruennichi]|uniref:Na(+)/H(+) exchanger protein 2-like isoform X2 n=1 Tax=Argiope bruennichi TaxID=94029 RepID=UPI00249462FE|nr:Na(+)/H(+) exchanger protein 2-like isoform X2 [Argiope bruennichi]
MSPASSQICNLFFLLLLISLIYIVCGDESRAVIDDTVSRQHHEAIQPETDSHEDYQTSDDGPLVLPVSYHHDMKILNDKPPSQKGGFKMATLKLEYVGTPFLIALWMLIAGLTKIGFHVTPKISLICPESCLLIVVGVIIGLLLFYAGLTNVGPLTPNVFFLYMLPPIVLDAGYYMPNRPFFDNLVTILLFAVVGTVFNAMTVGMSLWAVGLTGLYGVEMPLLDTLLFSSIACAVDPIAVLAVFEEIHVNEVLYILVFGESLLNDAVTVVLYHMFEGYAEMGPKNIITVDYLAGVASFFVVALGGTIVGILWGLLAAFVSRFTHHVRVIEPLFVFVMAYLSYVSAELFHFSGILALTFCGITMKNYVEENISYKSHVTVKYAMKMLASSSETIIFLFLGVSTVNDNHEWNTWFVVMTIFFCSVYRTIGVIILTALANRFRLHRIDKVAQFILAYGGLRGAVAFALVLIVSDRIIPTKNMMVTTIIALVFFTVFIQGMTIGPLVRILNVPTTNKIKLSMNERIITRSMDHLMAAIEDIVGQTMGNYHLRDKFKYYNNKYLRPVLTREHQNAEPKIFETYSKLNVADAMNLVKSNSNLVPVAANGLGTSLSSIFRTYTQLNMDKSPSDEKGNFLTADIPRNNSSFLNVDIATLEYSPSHKDLADAQLHHILSDAMFKPTRRRYMGRDGGPYDQSSRHAAEDSRSRLQTRHMMNDRMQPRRLNNLSYANSAASPSSKDGKRTPNNHAENNSEHSERSTSSAFSDGNNTKGLITGKKKQQPPPPKLRFSVADDDPSDSDNPMPMPTQTGAAKDEPLSAYSSLLDVSSAQDDDGIVFTVHGARTPSPNQNTDAKDGTSESDNDDSLRSIPTKTLTELTLPWKRDVETGVGGSPDSNTFVHRQQEFPAWVENCEYHIFESPTNTLLSRLGASSKRVSAPSVFEIFNQAEAKLPDASTARRNSQGSVTIGTNGIEIKEDNPTSASNLKSTRIDIDSNSTKDVVIEIKANGTSQRSKVLRGDLKDEDDMGNQATRL